MFNLEPDFTFPGKVVGIDTQVRRSVNGDHLVTATLHLSSAYGDGAGSAMGRLSSPADTYLDLRFYRVHDDPYTLSTEFTLNRYAAAGYWNISPLTVTDTAVRVVIPLGDAHMASLGGYATLQQYDSQQQVEQYTSYDASNGAVVFRCPMRTYVASGEWVFREFWVSDEAGNQGRCDLKNDAISLNVTTPSPDYVDPELDISSIRITAFPRHPEAPDGETDVTIWYTARDDNSGIGLVSYRLLNPTGGSLFD